MARRKLIIDAQIFQTAAKDRGMGRYSVYLIRALIKASLNKTYDEISVVISGNISTSRQAEKELKNLFTGAAVHRLDLKITSASKLEDSCEHNRRVLTEFVDQQMLSGHKVDFLIPSLFQEPIAAVFPDNSRKLLVFYDLIPYLYHREYELIMGPGFKNYLKRFKYIFEADKVFCISQTVLDDLHIFLGVPLENLVRIDGAATTSSLPPEKPKIALPERFILMPTSDDPRKNNLMTVLGFEEYRVASDDQDIKLVITSSIQKRERENLKEFSSNLIFTGNLPERQLDWLYQHCQSVLFVPNYEGLGLPVLEAVEFGKPVACSDIGAFKEISENAFSYCTVDDTYSIAEAIAQSLTATPSVKAYEEIKRYYSWAKTTERFLTGLPESNSVGLSPKPRVAVFTPTPDGLSAIGKVVAETHPTMTKYFDVEYFLEKGLGAPPTRPNYLQYAAKSYPAEAFSARRYADYDAVIYHIGNGDYHMESIQNALCLPGYAIIHETNINEAFRVMVETDRIDSERVKLEDLLSKKGVQAKKLTSILSRQLGVISHSQHAGRVARQIVGEHIPVQQANLPTAVPSMDRSRDEQKVVIGLAGILADIKGLEIIEAIANSPIFHNCEIRLFGFSFVPQATIDRLNSYENTFVDTSLTDLEFRTNLSKLDIFVNYRMSYNGETSLSTIEAMRSGVAVIVRDVGWYSELPDSVVIKSKSVDDVFASLEKLIKHKTQIKKIAQAAKHFVAYDFTHEKYVENLKAIIATDKKDNPNQELGTELKNQNLKTPQQYLNFLKRKKTL